jgi:enoyl-CoA hydratase/carnithine racemase
MKVDYIGLDNVERLKVELIYRNKTIQALILTNQGKFFSNGLDLKFLGENNSSKVTSELVSTFNTFLARLLTFPVTTVAAMNGHSFGTTGFHSPLKTVGAGLFAALACDFRVFNSERGWCCFPLAEISLLPGAGFTSLARCQTLPD